MVDNQIVLYKEDIRHPYKKIGIKTLSVNVVSSPIRKGYCDAKDKEDNGFSQCKHLKNESSKRKIPVHKALKGLGFMDFVEQQKSKGRNRLFTDLNMTRDGYGGNASKWFSRYIKKQGVIHRKKSFHSFRHTLVKELKIARVNPKEIAGLVGHYDADITTNRYGNGEMPITILDEAIQKSPPHRDDI